ncbi:MAG: sulfatase-like hydrolase/transferase, partial [Myxococcota bacterium]
MRLLSAGVLGLVLGAGLLWWFQEDVLLGLVGFAMSRTPVGPHEPIAWQSGPDPLGRTPDARPPNIVVILADDLGWNDLSSTGSGVGGGAVPTPNIDSIAATGVSFSNGYSANGTCAPSRAALMSGRYGTRFGFEFTPTPPGFSQMVPYLANRMPGRLHPAIRHEGGGKATIMIGDKPFRPITSACWDVDKR